MQHALPAARRQVEQVTRTERRRFLESLASQLPTTALLQILHATYIEDWLSFGPLMLDRLTTAVLTGTAACADLHAALPCHSSLAKYRVSHHTRVHELHQYLYTQQRNNEQIPSRMFGPAPSKAPLFNGLKAILSSTILSEDLLSTSKTDFSHRFQQAIKLMQRFRQEHLPPDRQVMAALLQLGNLAPSESLVHLEESDIFGWSWREWTVLRENEPDLVADDVLLVGFLEIAGKLVSQKENNIRPQVDEELSTPVWIRQAYQMGINKADVRDETGLSSTHYHIEHDQPPETNHRLLRALAVAAIHLDRYETAFTCLLDHRMRPKHIIPVLYALCGRVDAFERIDPDMAHKLVLACAEYLPSLTPRVPRSFSPKHAKELSAFVAMLVRNDCMPAAGAFMKIPSSPLRLGEGALLTICRLLTRQTGSQLLEQIYRSLPPSSWRPRLLEVFLSSADFPLSKEIWTYVRTRQDFGERKFLDARLRHHLRQPILRYRSCMKDFERTVRDLDVQPNASTLLLYLDVHIRAGCGFRARCLYNELASLQDPPEGLETRFLQLAGLPAWPQYRRRGASSQMMRLGAHLDHLTAKGASLDAMSAQYVVRQSLRWAELNNEAIWAILKSGVSNASNLNWHRDLRPLFTAVKAAFKRRGEHEALQEVEEMEIRVRKEAIIRSRKAS